MEALSHQLLFDLAWAIQRLRGVHSETDLLMRSAIVRALEVVEEQRDELSKRDWQQLAGLLRELTGVMEDDEFEYKSELLPLKPPWISRVHVDLRPFLKEIRDRGVL